MYRKYSKNPKPSCDNYPYSPGYNSDRMHYKRPDKYDLDDSCMDYTRYSKQYEYQYHPSFDDMKYNRHSDYRIPYSVDRIELADYGPKPFVVNINEATIANTNFRTALWTGDHLQVTLMSIDVGEDIGFEVHNDLDQFIRIEEGQGLVLMGDNEYKMSVQANVSDDFAFVIPAGTLHNLINTGNIPLKVYSIYAPPQHPFGTVHETKEDAEEAENHKK